MSWSIDVLFFRYVYTDDAELDGNTVMECMYAAKKYALHGLVDTCVNFLEGAVTFGTSCQIYEQAKFYGETTLQAKCFEFIVDNSLGVFRSGGFKMLTYESLYKIMACDYLASDESVNFSAVKRWAEHQCKIKNQEASPHNLRANLGDILYQVRFPLMSSETFAKEVAHTGVLSNEELLDLYYYLATKSGSKGLQLVGKFPCKKRNIVVSIENSSLSKTYEGCVILLNTSNPVKLVAFTGDFVSDICRINASNVGRQDVAFEAINGQLNLIESLLIRPHSGNIQIVFTRSSKEEEVWSSSVNISRTVKETTINVRRVPHGLKSLVFEET